MEGKVVGPLRTLFRDKPRKSIPYVYTYILGIELDPERKKSYLVILPHKGAVTVAAHLSSSSQHHDMTRGHDRRFFFFLTLSLPPSFPLPPPPAKFPCATQHGMTFSSYAPLFLLLFLSFTVQSCFSSFPVPSIRPSTSSFCHLLLLTRA